MIKSERDTGSRQLHRDWLDGGRGFTRDVEGKSVGRWNFSWENIESESGEKRLLPLRTLTTTPFGTSGALPGHGRAGRSDPPSGFAAAHL